MGSSAIVKWLLLVLAGAAFAYADNVDPSWLQMNVHNPAGTHERLKPEWTVIVTSVKPQIRQLDISCWEISFH
jgi:hypothetical protein